MCVSDAKHVGFRLYKDKSSDFSVINILESLPSDTTVKDYIVAAILAYSKQQEAEYEKTAEMPMEISVMLATIKNDTVKIFEHLQNMSVSSSSINESLNIEQGVNTAKDLSAGAINILEGLVF